MSLIERLEAAEVGSRELDVSMYASVEGLADSLAELRWQAYLPVTTSLDAAIATAERLFPKWMWQMDLEPGRAWFQGSAEPWPEGLVASDRGGVYAHAKTPALALCCAILKAMKDGH